MWVIFTEQSPYKKRARYLAIGWTLLIFVLCCLPGDELPDLDIPFVDKWTHVILFAGFSFFWLCAVPGRFPGYWFIMLLLSVFTGWLVEYIQGHYIPGRYEDRMDTLADAIGGLVGIIIFAVLSFSARRRVAVQ